MELIVVIYTNIVSSENTGNNIEIIEMRFHILNSKSTPS